jgi:hypothetical protein
MAEDLEKKSQEGWQEVPQETIDKFTEELFRNISKDLQELDRARSESFWAAAYTRLRGCRLTEREYKLYEELNRGKIVTEKEESVIYRLALIGLCKLGIIEENGCGKEIASLTKMGKGLYEIEKMRRTLTGRLKLYLYQFVSS